MFNFQKEVVLNTLDKAAVVEATDKGLGKPNIDPKVRFHDGGEYFGKYIVESTIYKTAPVAGKVFELFIDPSEYLGEHIQILVELGLDNDYRGDYGSALYYFRKPILVDVVLPKESKAAVKAIADAFTKSIPAEYKFVTVRPYDSNHTRVKISGADSYQKVRKVVVTVYECDERCSGSSEEPVEALSLAGGDLLKASGTVSYTANTAEFGTYTYLLHNLRLPTYENYRFTSPSAAEMPIPGAEYVQYSFAYCVPRVGFGGMSVVGQTNHSTTLHTFFVLKSLASDFEKLWDELTPDVEFVDVTRGDSHNITILPDQFASTADLVAAKTNNAQENTLNSVADALDNVYTKEEIDEELAKK